MEDNFTAVGPMSSADSPGLTTSTLSRCRNYPERCQGDGLSEFYFIALIDRTRVLRVCDRVAYLLT